MELKGIDTTTLTRETLVARPYTVDSALKAIYAAIGLLNSQLSSDRQLEQSLDTPLFGHGGKLDSLALANLIIIAEQQLEECFGFKVDLTEDDPFSPGTGHFRTVRSLATYASTLADQNRSST